MVFAQDRHGRAPSDPAVPPAHHAPPLPGDRAGGDRARRDHRVALVRDRGDGRRGSTSDPNLGKRAVTHVRPLERLGKYTLIECRLETGARTRSASTWPKRATRCAASAVYNQPLLRQAFPDESGARAWPCTRPNSAFEHPATGERLQFEMPLPDDLQQFLNRLRQEASSDPERQNSPRRYEEHQEKRGTRKKKHE